MGDERFPVSMNVEGKSTTLKVFEAHLETGDAASFEEACEKLLETGQPELIVDVTSVQTIQSIIIGEIAKTKVIASEAGRKFRLVANEKIAAIFRMILEGLVEIEVV